MLEEFDLFSFSTPKFKIDKPIRLIELFAGIGAQAKALENLGVQFEHHKVVEIEKYAMMSYNAIHNTNFETSDICKLHAEDLEITDRDKYTYIMTYSFPCQDLSLAGNQKGMTKGSGTRSGLLWEVERILDECNGNLPQVLLMENVPQVIGKKNIKDFQKWRAKLETLGYSNAVKILNSKEIGYPHPIPQNRARCFMVSILGDYHYSFPKKQKLELRLKDLLEDKVDERYYLSDKALQGFVSRNERYGHDMWKPKDGEEEASTTLSRVPTGTCDNYVVSGYIEKGTGEHQSNKVYSSGDESSVTLQGNSKSFVNILVDE